LPDTGLDPIQAAQNLHRTLQASGFPSRHRFQFPQYGIEAIPEIAQHMICVSGKPVLGV
jgi:hypothetical protein